MARKQIIALTLGGVLLTAAWALAQTPAAPDEPGPAPAEVAAPPARSLSLLDLLLKGGPLMYPLAICSIVMIAFAIERGFGLRRSKILPDTTMRCIRRAIDEAPTAVDPQKLMRELAQHDDPLARVTVSGLRKAHRPLPEIEKAIEDAGERESSAIRRNCRVLSIVASIAPLLGLLGTVTGMIRAFMTVAGRAEALGRTELLAAGIYEALVTTAVGLAIAIPALVCYYIYAEKIEALVSEIDSISEELVVRLPAKA